jgi:hypothetical protein
MKPPAHAPANPLAQVLAPWNHLAMKALPFILAFIVLMAFLSWRLETRPRRQRARLYAVDLDKLSEADRLRWQAYHELLASGRSLGRAEMADINGWPKRR